MRDTLATIDAGRAGLDRFRHHLSGSRLLVRIHRVDRVAIAAFARVGRLHRRPDVLRELEPVRFEFFAGADGAENLVQHLVGSLDLSLDLVDPDLRHVAVRTYRAHAGPVFPVMVCCSSW